MKITKTQLLCDYCERKSRLYNHDENFEDDGWRHTESEIICPDCQKKKDIPITEVGNRLKDVFKFKNLQKTADAAHIGKQNLTNLNAQRAGDGIKHLSLLIINLAEALPLKKRRKILSNMDFMLDS